MGLHSWISPKSLRMQKDLIIIIMICFISWNAEGRRRNRKKGGASRVSPLTTCPGYCSESYPGDVCLVVCARGRNNVPVCQEDGTWTDQPRCSEHVPGNNNQITPFCPGVPGYCSLDYPGGLRTFECSR